MATRALATAFVNIVPGTADLETYLRGKLASDVGAAGIPAGQGYATGMGRGFGSRIKSSFMPVLGSLGVAFGAIGVANFVKDMYSSAVEGQKVDAVLGKVADSMGLFGGQTDTVVKRLQDYATAQMKMTGIDDDVIKTAQAKLLTFKNLASSAGEMGGMFDRATAVSADMAAVFGGDASSNAVLLGKALNDPVKGLASLSRVGVQFTEDQKELIKGMVESGDVAGAQTLIMKELETQVGGTAEASATAGEIMKAKFDDAVQSLGTTLMPVFEGIVGFIADTFVPAMENGAAGVKAFLGWFGDNQGWLVPVLSGIGGALLGLATYTTAMGIAASIAAAGGLPAIIGATWAWTAALLANPITWIILGIGALVAAIVALAMNWEAVTAWVHEVWGSFVSWLTDGLNSLASWWDGLWSGIATALYDTWTSITTWFESAVSAVLTWFRNNWQNILGFITGPIGMAISWISGNWAEIVDFFESALKNIGKWFSDTFEGIGEVVRTIFGNIVGFVKAPLNAIISAINSAIRGINSLKIDVPDWVPGIGGQKWGFSIPTIPALAKGGFVTSPTTALIGEKGPEVVTPLKDFERMMGMDGGRGNTVNYYAAPNTSLDSEQALFDALKRAKVLAGWA
jgi:phage-related minor tail protein